MKKVIISTSIILALFVVGFVMQKNFRDGFERDVFLDADSDVSRDDDFHGPEAGSHLNDRDGVFDSLVVSPDDPNLIFVGTENNALFRSDDGGENWQWIRRGFWHNRRSFPEFYDIEFGDDGMMYAALTNGPQDPEIEKAAGFYRSFDDGLSWERSVEGLPNTAVTAVELIEGGEGRVIIGLDGEEPTNHRMKGRKRPIGGIYFSDDKGSTWQTLRIPEKGKYNRYSRIAARNSVLYAAGHKFGSESPGKPRGIDLENSLGLIKSDDRGETWELISPSGAFPYYFDVSSDGDVIYFSDGVSGNGYVSTNGGKNWEKTSVSFSNVIRISSHDSKIAIFASGNQLFKTEDGLLTRKKVFEIQGQGGFDDIEFTSDSKIIYAAGDGYRVYKSTDGGDSFFQIANLREFIEKLKQ
jgi:photosystem II stability/assembly factor-like uncharacterized protein